ncbi:MAG: helix-turn-helix domain-containing protein [Planctomycetes bacterium]|nr:helix-turn-helix domain-containing protein [Planctomycetota bacterium]
MSVTSVARKGTARGIESKRRSGYLTTTELSRLCGVSRFTIINWIKRGRIKVIRTVGRHYRIPVSEALSLLRTFEEKQKDSSKGSEGHFRQKKSTTINDEKRGNCLTSNETDRQIKPEKKNVLYAFGYRIGCGVHVLKGRSKDK